MKLQYKFDDKQISDMNMTMRLTMTVAQWRELMRTATTEPHYAPINKLQNMISAALGDLTNATEKSYSVNEWMKKEVE